MSYGEMVNYMNDHRTRDTGWSRTKKWNGHSLRFEGDGSAFLNGDYFGVNFASMAKFINYLETSKGERETYFNMKR